MALYSTYEGLHDDVKKILLQLLIQAAMND
jgi:hypothetical protein